MTHSASIPKPCPRRSRACWSDWPRFPTLARDPRVVLHALIVVLALTACAVLTGATSLPAVGEWITDARRPS
ncbi:transposase family protein [Streptomyces chromofuscus]|uniref:transposase family protein n=1 Tax=Streptomyces chromofuscus TaxID=42881 RepID=UPI001671D189|nr:transposase family protein [Streptomyces chromofuscus]